MDTYLNFHRQSQPQSPSNANDEKALPSHPNQRRPLARDNTEADRALHPRWKGDENGHEKRPRWNHLDAEKGFSPRFPSLQDLSSDEAQPRQKYLSSSDNDNETSPYQAAIGRDHSSDEALNKLRTANSVTITPELFEKLYLNPQNKVSGDLRATFANPTPVGLLGFLLSGGPLACEMMGWRGAGGNGVAMVAVYYFVGGFLMSLGGILEFFLGNTFSFVVFLAYGSFWFALGGTLTPAFNAYGAYVDNPGTNPNLGITSPDFHATFAFYLLFMALMSVIYLICALRTNLTFIAIFFGLAMCFALDTGSYWHVAAGNSFMASKLQIAAGGFLFLAVMAGWWIFFAQLLASVDFPFEVPVGDISHFIRPMSEVKAAKSKYPAPR